MATLVPGTTSPPDWAPLAVPAQQGNSTACGYGYAPMARWQTPGFQTYGGTGTGELTSLNIDILAFHPCGRDRGDEGIQKITFIANNGTPLDVTVPTVNPVTGRWSWWCTMGTLAVDGVVEVRAIVYPWDGIPFVMQGAYRSSAPHPTSEQSLVCWSNGSVSHLYTRPGCYVDGATGNDSTGTGASGAPFATVLGALTNGLGGDFNNVYILLKPGAYTLPLNSGTVSGRSRWFTLRPAPGITRSQVSITTGVGVGRSPFSLIHLQDVTIDQSVDPPPFRGRSQGDKCILWLDGCDEFGKGRDDTLISDLHGNSSVDLQYITSSATNRFIFRDWAQAHINVASQIMLGMDVNNVSSDLADVGNVRDCTWRDIRSIGDYHPDWAQTSSVKKPNCMWVDNVVYDAAVQLWFQTDTIAQVRHCYVNNILANQVDGKGSNLFMTKGGVYWNNTHSTQSIDYWTETTTGNEEPSGLELSDGVSMYGNIMRGRIKTERKQVLGTPVTEANFTSVVTGMIWDYNHNWGNAGTTTWSPGNNATTGVVTYRNAATGDFYPLGPAEVTAGIPRTVRWDRKQTARSSLTYKGALEYDGTTSAAALAPTFSPVGGVYESARTVTITGESHSSIFYTTNGTTPTTGSTAYTGPVSIPVTTTLKAIATKIGLSNSSVTSATYTIGSSGVPVGPLIVVSAVGSTV